MPKLKRKSVDQINEKKRKICKQAKESSDYVSQQAADTSRRRIARQNEDYRTAERLSDARRRRSIRQNQQRRDKEQASNTAARRSIRQDQQRRVEEQASNTAARRSVRQNKQRRVQEQSKNTAARRSVRQNQQRRDKEQTSNTAARHLKRQDPQRHFREQKSNTAFRHDKRKKLQSSYEKLLNLYTKQIQNSPSFICSCCGGLWYENSTSIVSSELLQARGLSLELIEKVLYVNQKCHRLCCTCMKSVNSKSNRLPKLALYNGFDFPFIPNELKDLSPLEERLVAPRLPFMQIRQLGYERQSQLRGNVVNVENDLDICARVLPRKFDETSTVQVQLMRKMEYRKPYMHETIRPYKVFQAAKYLIDTELYITENVTLCDDWKNYDADTTLDFICSSADERTLQHESTKDHLHVDIPPNQPCSSAGERTIHHEIAKNQIHVDIPENSAHKNDDHDDQINVDIIARPNPTIQRASNTGAEETLIFREDDLISHGIQIAPAQGNTPVPLHRDFNAEVLSFPCIYGGASRKFKKGFKVSYTDIAKSELRRYDRRACFPTKIL